MNKLPQDSIQSTYRQIFKATSIFGGVQVFNIMVTVVRGKILSVILGPDGMGINGILMSTLTMLRNATSLGIPESAVRNIAAANSESDQQRIQQVLSVFNKWIFVTLIISVLLMILLSRLISNLVFGNSGYTGSFMVLSVALVLMIATGATYTVLRGLQKTKHLAIANVLGTVLGLVSGLPLIYLYGIDGIVPSIIMSSLVTFIISLYFRRKIKIVASSVGWKNSFTEGLEMARLGISLSTTMLLAAIANFVLPSFITAAGSIHDAGLYNAGVTLSTGYVGLVFTAMITDYFPRLAGCITEHSAWTLLVNQQAELVVLILTPILVILITTAPFIIRVLLTVDFMDVVLYVPWASLGIFLQGVAWAMAAVIVAKGDYRAKLYTEVISQLVFIGVSLAGYLVAGMVGLGFAFLVSKLFDLLLIAIISRRRYDFRFNRSFSILALSMLACCVLAAVISILVKGPLVYIAGAGLVLLALTLSLYELNKRIDIRDILNRFTN